MKSSNQVWGASLTLLAAILWGFSGTCGQYIFENFGADAQYLTAVRLLTSGLILNVIGIVTSKNNMISIFKEKKSAVNLIGFAIGGIMACQLSYMMTISYTNSGTATILQYLGPVLIMIYCCLKEKKLPVKKEFIAIIMALLGIFFVATHGNINTMVITPLGLIWGIISAVALATNTLIPEGLVAKYGSITVTGLGMTIGGIFLCLISKVWEAPMIYDWRCIVAFVSIVIFGTVIPFTIFYMGMNIIGPIKASMLASVEPAAATIFMIIWLDSPFQLMDLIGFTCIFVTIFLVMRREEKENNNG